MQLTVEPWLDELDIIGVEKYKIVVHNGLPFSATDLEWVIAAHFSMLLHER